MKLITPLFTLLLFFYLSTPVHAVAGSTGWVPATSCSGGTNCSDSFVDDNTSTTVTGANSITYSNFGLVSIPSNATITGIRLKTKASVTNTTGTVVNIIGKFSWNNGSTFWNYPTNCASNTTDRAPTTGKLTTSLTEYSIFTSGLECGLNHTWIPSDMANGSLIMTLTPNASDYTGKTFNIDYAAINIEYDYPVTEASITDIIINESTGDAYVDIDGYVNYSCSESLQCYSYVYENCSATDKSPIVNKLVFTGMINDYDTGFCSPDDQNFAITALFPVEPDYNCSYAVQIICNEDGQQVVNTALDLGNPSELNTLPIPEADSVNPFGWLSNQFRQILQQLFSINITAYSEWQNTKYVLTTRAPFAYITPIFDIEFSSTDIETIDLGTVDFDLPGFNIPIDMDFTSLYEDFFSPIHTALTYLMWFAFFSYLIFWFKNHNV